MESSIKPHVVNAVIYLTELKTNAIISFGQIRTENLAVDVLCKVVELVVGFFSKAFLWATRFRIEPPSSKPYISTYYYDNIIKHSGENVVFVDSPESESFRDKFYCEYQELVKKANDGHLANTTILVARIVPDIVRIRLAINANGEKDIMDPFVKSDVRFLTVEYFCKKMHQAIRINIPKSHYVVGNELLSTEYVLRYLEYLPIFVYWDFDEFYTIRVVDENLEKIELKSNQWILLTENGYEVQTMDKDEEEEEEEEPGSPLDTEEDEN